MAASADITPVLTAELTALGLPEGEATELLALARERGQKLAADRIQATAAQALREVRGGRYTAAIELLDALDSEELAELARAAGRLERTCWQVHDSKLRNG